VKMNFKKQTDIAWLAGVVDRLSSISENDGMPSVNLCMKGKLPKILHQEFGGSYFRNVRGVPLWKLRGRKTRRFLKLVLPYLKLHRIRAKRLLYQ